MVKLFIKYLFMGITWGSFLFIANLIIFDLANAEFLPNIFDNITAVSLGFIAVSIGFITSSIVYEIEQLRFGLKLLIHATIGIVILLSVGFVVGIFTTDNLPVVLVNIILNLSIILVVWVRYYIREKNAVQKINEKLQEQHTQSDFDTE